jgi:DNA-binding transcriptional ArsR family regulator
MTEPPDLGHPLRIRILEALGGRTASPAEIAGELSLPLQSVSYHFRQLRRLGAIELVRTVPRRGAIKHYYGAVEDASTP